MKKGKKRRGSAKYVAVRLRILRERREEIREVCAKSGQSLKSFVQKAILSHLELVKAKYVADEIMREIAGCLGSVRLIIKNPQKREEDKR